MLKIAEDVDMWHSSADFFMSLPDLIAFKDWSKQKNRPGHSAHLWMILKMGNTHLYDIIHLLNCARGRHSARLKKIVEILNEAHLLRQVENSYNIEYILPHLLWKYPKVHWNAYIRAVLLLDAHLFEHWYSTQSPKYLKQSALAKWNY